MLFLDKPYTKLELESACDVLTSITPSEPLNNEGKLYKGRYENYDDKFPGDKLRHGDYIYCTFEKTKFHNTIGNSSSILNCKMRNCIVENANFIYSDFTNTHINASVNGSNLEYCDFSKASFIDGAIKGTSFDNSYFQNTVFKQVFMDGCSFNGSILYYTEFSNVDLTSVSFNQTQITNPHFSGNVTLPFFHILQIATGIEQILSYENLFFKPVGSEYMVNTQEYINDIHMLIPVFFEENNYIALANIYKYDGDIERTKAAIFTGLRYSIKTLDFELINNLCKFASMNSYFSLNTLKEFYKYIEDNMDTTNLSRVNYHKYINETHLAKSILIDCPYNQTVMEIMINSNFSLDEDEKLKCTLNSINGIINDLAPNSKSNILIRHNSPIEFTITISDNYQIMLLCFVALGAAFMYGCEFINRIQELIKNHQDIKTNKLEIKLKELEIKEKEIEKNKKTSIICPKDFKSMSYILFNPKEIPKDLLRMRF